MNTFRFMLPVLLYCLWNVAEISEGVVTDRRPVSGTIEIHDVPELEVKEGSPVTIKCHFTLKTGSKLREVVWYREVDNDRVEKLFTIDTIMNITVTHKRANRLMQIDNHRALHISDVNATDDGWYQCHVGAYNNGELIEGIGYAHLNVLVPPSDIHLTTIDTAGNRELFKKNFSLACTVKRVKPLASLIFMKNGENIMRDENVNDTVLMENDALPYLHSIGITYEIAESEITVTHGFLLAKNENETNSTSSLSVRVSQNYTMLHIKARRVNSKVWECASFLLWSISPSLDAGAEYGCKVIQHGTKEQTEARQILSSPDKDMMEIETVPKQPKLGDNVMLRVKRFGSEQIFPEPVLLWSNTMGPIRPGKKYLIGDTLMVPNARKNNTVYQMRAFNPLGSVVIEKTLVLRQKTTMNTKYKVIRKGKQINKKKAKPNSSMGKNGINFLVNLTMLLTFINLV